MILGPRFHSGFFWKSLAAFSGILPRAVHGASSISYGLAGPGPCFFQGVRVEAPFP
jgi:hypothetical protein